MSFQYIYFFECTLLLLLLTWAGLDSVPGLGGARVARPVEKLPALIDAREVLAIAGECSAYCYEDFA